MRSTHRVARSFAPIWPLVLAALALPRPPALEAQAVDDGNRLWSLFSELSPATRLAITTSGLRLQGGTLEGVMSDSVRIVHSGLLVGLAFREIEAVAVERNRTVAGILGGTAAGVLIGSSFGLMVGSFGCDSRAACVRDGNDTALKGAIAVGLAGALGGGLFGRSQVRWKTIFP